MLSEEEESGVEGSRHLLKVILILIKLTKIIMNMWRLTLFFGVQVGGTQQILNKSCDYIAGYNLGWEWPEYQCCVLIG